MLFNDSKEKLFGWPLKCILNDSLEDKQIMITKHVANQLNISINDQVYLLLYKYNPEDKRTIAMPCYMNCVESTQTDCETIIRD